MAQRHPEEDDRCDRQDGPGPTARAKRRHDEQRRTEIDAVRKHPGEKPVEGWFDPRTSLQRSAIQARDDPLEQAPWLQRPLTPVQREQIHAARSEEHTSEL